MRALLADKLKKKMKKKTVKKMKNIVYMILKEICRAGLAAVLAYLGIATSGCFAVGSSSTACLINSGSSLEK